MSYQLSVAAEQDVIDIFTSGAAQFGAIKAEQYHTKLKACFEFLERNPLAAHSRAEIAPPVRMHPIGAHLVIYLLKDNLDVLILRVRHCHEDWLSH